MAAQISHIIAGEKALQAALGSKAAVEGLGTAAPFFRLGCQGPDIFYHNQRTKPSGLHYGALAHRRRFGSIVAGAASALGADDRSPLSPVGAYLIGLATHAAVDRATHPFIIYFAGWFDASDPKSLRRRGCHPFLERVLDLGLLERELGMAPRDFRLAERLGIRAPSGADGREDAGEDAEIGARLVALWAAGLRAAYPKATDADPALGRRIANAFLDARHFFAVTDPAATAPGANGAEWLSKLDAEEGKRLVSLVYPELPTAGMDAMNEAGAEWLHPSGDGRRSRASYSELIARGSEDAARALGLTLEFWKGTISAATLAQEIGQGSLSLGESEGSLLPPRVCAPLALPEAMEAEYAARVGARVDASEP